MKKRLPSRFQSIFLAFALAPLLALDCPQLSHPTVRLKLVAENLTAPIGLIPIPHSKRMYILDQVGLIHVLDSDGTVLPAPFLDIRDRLVPLDPAYDERGLLGMALHPRFRDNGLFYVYYSAPLRAGAPVDFNCTNRLSEFRITDATAADPASERILLQVDKPQMNHNGGQITFGPDRYLYIPLGDGGGANDDGVGHVEDWYAANAGGNGQDITHNLLGSILRIDVDHASPGREYAIPSDNPFVGTDALPEQWAYGLRNPWRISFDRAGNNALFAADAGQDLFEEVDIIRKGGNYGWNVREGTHCFSTATPTTPPAECPSADPQGNALIDPVIEFTHDLGEVVIGGYVYRGTRLLQIWGAYVFGVWTSEEDAAAGAIYYARPDGEGKPWEYRKLRIQGMKNGTLNEYLTSFGQDNNGELYILTNENQGPNGTTGKIYKLAPSFRLL